jgi:DNA-binding transcriptional MocR family regulator
MTIWPPKSQDLKRPAYRSLAERVVRAVEAGELKNGDRLPTHRELAYQLGLSVQTVSRAYEELIRRGTIAGEVGRGTFVRAGQTETRTPFLPDGQDDASMVDCSILKPVCDFVHMQYMNTALAKLGENTPETAVFSFRPSTALNRYRDVAASWLTRCGLTAPAEAIQLTNGATPAMTIALLTSTNPGELVVTERLGHHTLKPLTRYLGLRLQGLEIDREGILPDDFERVCATSAVKTLYVMPSGLNPTATMMSLERRQALCAVARKYDVLIVENDAWGPVQPKRPVPIAALAPERTFYFTSFTKCIMPGLRTGYLVVPETLGSAANNRQLVTNWMATPILAEIASRWIDDGTALTLLKWQMKALGRRNALAAQVLGDIDFFASPNGMHIWLPLPHSWNEEAFVAHARLNGVAVAPGSSFALSDPVKSPGVRVCLGATSETALQRGLEVIARLAKNQPEPALLTI